MFQISRTCWNEKRRLPRRRKSKGEVVGHGEICYADFLKQTQFAREPGLLYKKLKAKFMASFACP
jgi:hypothetical protein